MATLNFVPIIDPLAPDKEDIYSELVDTEV